MLNTQHPSVERTVIAAEAVTAFHNFVLFLFPETGEDVN